MKHYIGFLTRLVAYLIDSAIFIALTSMLRDSNGLFFILNTAYFVWMNGKYGATIGKMVMNIKIVKEDGSPLTYSDALIREIASYLSLFILGLGFLNIIWNPKKQSWHDIIAHTVVVKIKQ